MKKELPNIKELLFSKIVPISGDLESEGLGISQEDREMITNDCQIIFNIAASVDFNSRLDDAISINIDGALRMQQLAKEWKQIECFTHMSTWYVNSDKKGVIKEKIYDVDFDVEERINYLKSLNSEEIVKRTHEIIGKYPNTYTFSKSMGERLLKKNRGDLPMFIIRPSIVGWSYREPVPGWVDSISAAGAMVFFTGLGIIGDWLVDPNKIVDHVPWDYVWNATLIGTAFTANSNNLIVHNCGTSSLNQIKWNLFFKTIEQYFIKTPCKKQIRNPRAHLIASKTRYEMWFLLNSKLPEKFYSVLGSVNEGMKKNAESMVKVNERGHSYNQTIPCFTLNAWIFDSPLNAFFLSELSSEERAEFNIDMQLINWKHFTHLFCYGIQIFVLRQKDVSLPIEELYNEESNKISKKNFGDVSLTISEDEPKPRNEIINRILISSNIKNSILDFISK